jgi:hypothetical protein
VQRGPHIQSGSRRPPDMVDDLGKKSRLAKIADGRFLRLMTLWDNLLASARKRAHDL